MNADENPYESPTASDNTVKGDDDELEAKRRFRVGLIWGSSGCGYLASPWWFNLVTAELTEVVLVLALAVAAILTVTALVGVVLLALLGTARDLIGAACGAVFGFGVNACFVVETGVALLLYCYSGV